MEFKVFIESSLEELKQSAIAAFPETTKREHSTQTIRFTEMHWTPFLGVRTLFVKGTAENKENGHVYNPIILFKRVEYRDQPTNETVSITASDGNVYHLLPLTDNETNVRCQCKDFSFRFNFYNWREHSLYPPKRKPYVRVEGSNRPPANPMAREGICKHLIRFYEALMDAGLLL